MASELDLIMEQIGLGNTAITSDILGNRVGVRGRPKAAYLDGLSRALDEGRQRLRLKKFAESRLGGAEVYPPPISSIQSRPVPSSRALVPISGRLIPPQIPLETLGRPDVIPPEIPLEALRKPERIVSHSKLDIVADKPKTQSFKTSSTLRRAKRFSSNPRINVRPKLSVPTMFNGNIIELPPIPIDSQPIAKLDTVAKANKAASTAAKSVTKEVAKKGGIFSKVGLKGMALGALGYTGGEEIGLRIGNAIAEYTTDEEYDGIIKSVGSIGGGIVGSLVGLLPAGRIFNMLKIGVPAIGGLKLISGLFDDDPKETGVEEALKKAETAGPQEKSAIAKQIDQLISDMGNTADTNRAAVTESAKRVARGRSALDDFAGILDK